MLESAQNHSHRRAKVLLQSTRVAKPSNKAHSNAGLAKYENNNRVERLHGTVKDWIKHRRGAKEKIREFIEGYRICYNYVRPNMAIGNKTPVKTEKKLVVVTTDANNKTQKQT